MLLALLRRLRARWKHRAFERDLHEELATHRAMAVDDLADVGPSALDAEQRATRRLGNATLAREDSRAVWLPVFWQQTVQDGRHALRSMWRTPGFTLAAVSMLTLGLGMVAGGFVFLNGLFFRTWNVPDAHDVFVVNSRRAVPAGAQTIRDGISMGAYEHLDGSGRAAAYAAMRTLEVRVSVNGTDGGSHVNARSVSRNFIETLRIPLQRGHGFLSAPEAPTPRVVISDRLWQRTFNADPSIVGRTVWVNQQPVVVVAVLSPEFDGFGPTYLDLIAELKDKDADAFQGEVAMTVPGDDTGCCLEVVGRARPGSDRARVSAEVQGLITQYRRGLGLPTLTTEVVGTTEADTMFSDDRGQAVVRAFVLTAVGFGLVLVLTCANVGNLYLARSLRRHREISVRLAIGASRGRIVRQLLTEGSVLAAMAGAGALAVALLTPRLIQTIDQGTNPRLFAPDWRIVLFTVGVAATTALAVSLAPALAITRAAWRGGSRTITPHTGRTRSQLLAIQIALAAVLVLSATLLSRSIGATLGATADYALDETMFVWISDRDPAGESRASASVDAARAALLANSRGTIGLANAGMGSRGGLGGLSTSLRRSDEDLELGVVELPMSAGALAVLEVPLVQGRMAFDDLAAGEVVVNETLARILSRGNASGTTLRLTRDSRTYTVVGVVRDTHLTSFTDVPPIVHTPASSQLPMLSLLARSEAGAEARITALIQSVNPALTVEFEPLSGLRTNAIVRAAVGASMAAGLGLVALLVAAIGLVSVFAYIIEERRREIGIRLALGATRVQVRRSMFRATRGALVGGMATGLVLSLAAGRLLQGYLFGVSPIDPLSYLAVVVVLGFTALVAAAVPVRRAMRTEPAAILRAE